MAKNIYFAPVASAAQKSYSEIRKSCLKPNKSYSKLNRSYSRLVRSGDIGIKDGQLRKIGANSYAKTSLTSPSSINLSYYLGIDATDIYSTSAIGNRYSGNSLRCLAS